MHQQQFEVRYASLWKRLEELLTALENGSARESRRDGTGFPALYRQVCNHYALARSRCYTPDLVTRLHRLVLRGHRQLYRAQKLRPWIIIDFIGRTFPRTVRLNGRLFWLAFVLFFAPAGIIGISAYRDPAVIYSVMDQDQVARIEYMYDPLNRKTGRAPERTSATDVRMFGFYIYNNVSIGFRTFAGGIFLGLGTLLFLLFNGLFLGAVAGHLSHPPHAAVFWPFVSGHGAFELMAIVISGTAGLVLARALLRPGVMTRPLALRRAAPEALQLIMGAMVLFIIAALFEAFWSPSSVAAPVKLGVAAVNWLLVPLYLLRAGKNVKVSLYSGGSRYR
ncbi:stage II sporulation protein M [Thermodesulfobacteriota bacterium B35]